jgi:pyridoxamine 5'-phosphate oxidase
MKKQEILEFLKKNPVFFLATSEGDQPHVRAMMLYRADDDGVIFQSFKEKDLNKQIQENPNVELCFNNIKSGIQIRVSGLAETITDPGMAKEIIGKRPFLTKWTEEKGDDSVSVYRIKKPKASVWTAKVNFEPKNYIDLS